MKLICKPRVKPKSLLLLVAAVTIACNAFWLGPVMRESDQGSILFGVVRMTEGSDSLLNNPHYNYDKQFVTYWLLAAIRLIWPDADVVLLGNILSFTVFWAGIIWFLCRSRITSFMQVSAVIAALFSPILLLLSPYLSSAFVSAGLLLGAWSTWRLPAAGSGSLLAAFMLTFLAVGARADALLLLPWLAWCSLPAGAVSRLIFHRKVLLMIAAGATALIFGQFAYSGERVAWHLPFFFPKLYAGYIVFGLGAAGLVAVWILFRLIGVTVCRLRRRRAHAAFYALGGVAFLLPVTYYAFQMFSPRYWLLPVCGALGGALMRRSARLLDSPYCATICIIGALAPLFAGIHLPFPDTPKITFGPATVYPTSDGFQPMGALLHYKLAAHHAPQGVLDHNQATWLAAREAHYETDASGRVPVLEFSLRSYVQLAVALQGKTPVIVQADAPFFYSDTRDLLRARHTPQGFRVADRLPAALNLDIENAGPTVRNARIVLTRLGAPPSPEWRTALALADVFQGNDFISRARLSTRDSLHILPTDEGKTLVFHSTNPFSIEQSSGEHRHALQAHASQSNFFFVRLPGREWFETELTLREGSAEVSISIHPDYMGVGRLR